MKKWLWIQKYVEQQNGCREYGFKGQKVGLKEKLLGKKLRRDIAHENFPYSKKSDDFLRWQYLVYFS